MVKKVKICGIDTSTLPKLSAKECALVLEKVKKGDKQAKELFILGNMRLVLSVMKKFLASKISPDDLFQAGCIGLIKATDNFDLAFNVKFSTYAVPMILGEIKRYIRTRNSMRVSRSIRDTAYQVLQARSQLEKEDKLATNEEIAKKLNILERDVAYSLDAISDTVSLYDPVYNKEGETLLLVDQIADEKNTDECWCERVALSSALEKLNSREKRIIYLRYFNGKTQTEISKEVGISQAQVSRLEKSALSLIKSNMS